nr:hypothetical protein [Fournierella massiliensis]
MQTKKSKSPARASRPPRPQRPRRPKSPGSARRRPLWANAAFALLTVLILAVGGAGAVWASSRLTTPSDQIGSFDSLPVYNVIGQRTERVEFWPRARYHDRAQAMGYPLPYTPRQAFEENNASLILQNLILYSNFDQELTLSLSSQLQDTFACYSYASDNVVCRFYDNIPIQIADSQAPDTPIYQGVINSSSGRMISTGRYCYSALITPSAAMDAPTEEQYRQAYGTLLEQLLQLAGGGHQEAPYYCDGPLVWVLSTLQADFPSTVITGLGTGEEEYAEGEFSYTYSTLEWFCSTLLDNFQKNEQLLELPPWEQINWPEPNPNDPEAVERFLQEYYSTMYNIDLQILRQDGCYLVLFQISEHTLGLYFDPLLQAYTGFGLQ